MSIEACATLEKERAVSERPHPERGPLLPANPKVSRALHPREDRHALPDKQGRVDLAWRRNDRNGLDRGEARVEERQEPDRRVLRVSITD